MSDTAKLIYLACPYSDADPAVRQYRVDQATRAAAWLAIVGDYVYSPLTHSAAIVEAGGEDEGEDYWRAHGLRMLRGCDALVVLQLSGWGQSVGVAAEIWAAEQRGIPVDYLAWPIPEDITPERKET